MAPAEAMRNFSIAGQGLLVWISAFSSPILGIREWFAATFSLEPFSTAV